MKDKTETLNELKKLLTSKRLIFGKERTIKNLKQGKLEKIYICSNCAADVVQTIGIYAKQADVKLEMLEISNVELGEICRKPFIISVIGLLKNGS